MSSKQKKNFDFDKKIPKSKKTEENQNEHKAIKENVQDEPIQEKEEETTSQRPRRHFHDNSSRYRKGYSSKQ